VVREKLAKALRRRRAEIEEAVIARAHWISDPSEVTDPAYAEGLRRAVGAAVDYGIETVALGDDEVPPVPSVLLEQARFAARSGVSLDTVLRRYVAGFYLFGDYVLREAEAWVSDGAVLRGFLQAQAPKFDRVLEATSEEHARACDSRMRTPRQRQAESVKRVLAGEHPQAAGLDRKLEGWHLGAVAIGPGAAAAMRAMVSASGADALQVTPQEDHAWLWLGAKEKAALPAADPLLSVPLSAGVSVALGEPAPGLPGWRLTHRQAAAAISLARPAHRPTIRYGEVALLVTALRDDLLVASVRQAYLEPLCAERDDGAVLLDTLRAYFRAERNASSAAALLRVNRQTVANRLRAVEQRVGRSLPSCAMEIELALQLHDLESSERSAEASELPQPHPLAMWRR
jgi:hypothetical protein